MLTADARGGRSGDSRMRTGLMRLSGAATLLAALVMMGAAPASAQTSVPSKKAAPAAPETFSSDELVNSGHRFFGNVSRGLAMAIEDATRKWGQPNGYILGQEGGAAFIGGLRYGEGKLYTRNAGDRRVFWQGPSVGFDFGGDGSRTMMLVYKLPSTDAIYQRFGGVGGSAYVIDDFCMTALVSNDIVVVA